MYEWVKILHILAIISWMAGLLYFPRLLIYHFDAEIGSDQSETFKIMERRLMKAIMTPAMIVSWVAGLWLIHLLGAWDQPWMWGKFALVIAMTAAHFKMAGWRKAFERDERPHSTRYYRVANEVPTGLMIGIVILVVVKPF